MRLITRHPYRTKKVLDRLEDKGLIISSLEPFYSPNGKMIGYVRAITLTNEGKEYVENYILPNYEEYKRYIELILNGKTSQTP